MGIGDISAILLRRSYIDYTSVLLYDFLTESTISSTSAKLMPNIIRSCSASVEVFFFIVWLCDSCDAESLIFVYNLEIN